jgi:hypothetical protein
VLVKRLKLNENGGIAPDLPDLQHTFECKFSAVQQNKTTQISSNGTGSAKV